MSTEHYVGKRNWLRGYAAAIDGKWGFGSSPAVLRDAVQYALDLVGGEAEVEDYLAKMFVAEKHRNGNGD